jgi:GTP-binding protein YchF
MNIGIIGLPQTGKNSLFQLLVGKGSLDHHSDPRKIARGIAEIQDPRFDSLVDLYAPKRQTRARIEVLLPPKIEERAVSEGDIFRDLAEVEAFCHVVRAFENQSVYHVSGSIDPIRDIDFVNTEFILHDLLFIEKRVERIEKDIQKAKDERASREKDVLVRLKQPLENETPLRVVDIPAEDEKIIRSYPLLSRRAMIIVLNVSDSELGDDDGVARVNERYRSCDIRCIQVPVQMEVEVSQLESQEERDAFMSELGIRDTALHALTEKCIEALGLVSFFTVASAEVHQWFVRKGADAVEAAGKIHSDMARGFIRAEVIKYSDLVELGSEEKVKSDGKLGVRGKDYVVEDGDILFIRFSV